MNGQTAYSLFAFIVFSSLRQCTIVTDAFPSCPNNCSCGQGLVDCKDNGLMAVPNGIPSAVVDVDLSHNQITVIRNSSFENLVNLETLSLNDNDLKIIEVAAFYQLSSLVSLDLSNNFIQMLTARHFYHLPNLSKLSITGNPRLNVSVSAFQNLATVTEIIADGNLHSDAYDFSDLGSLEVLHLSDCKVRRFYADNFRSLRSLTTLILDNNELIEFPVDMLAGMKKLETLSLSGNLISDLRSYDFNNNRKLQNLDISKNDVESLEGVKFMNLTYLSSVDLRFNKIMALPEGLLKGLTPMSRFVLKVDDNPVVCDCRIKWLTRLDSMINVQASCVSPTYLDGVDAASVPLERLFCAPSEREGARLSSVVSYGESVNLTCPVTGDPLPDITWMYHNQSTASNTPVSKSFIRSSTAGDKLFYEAVKFDMAGIYICKATNRLGSVKVTLILSVVPLVAAKERSEIVSSCHSPVFLIVLLFTIVFIAAGVSFILYRKFLRAVRAQRNMDYANLHEPEVEAM